MIFKDIYEQQKCARLAENIANEVNISNEIKQAFANTPREIFMPMSNFAYELHAMPLSSNQWISSPITVAKMTAALEPVGADSVLEIGCGSGYQAALLSNLIRRVFSLERIEELSNKAIKNLETIEANVYVRYLDGHNGFKNYAPYDRILLSAYIKQVPDELFNQLVDGGILVAPVGDENKQYITKYIKHKDRIEEIILDSCIFVPMLNGRVPINQG
ncbi:protein-L-isoaspartate(D-aspartate) O-methyltransferase [Campylobacter sp. MG1]|uniref:protein-L-isoaspartate(D-aspartate) O-methyltransferase n=1 Tax=Campylobacter sp. MG1 TaxID=2976332 RepID=UPI00226CE0BA|nr:protein-L-isoaspartate(D-aspartate) O-methyltransferase [Campylobacter sp. MG1]